jgi:hypothetical protein
VKSSSGANPSSRRRSTERYELLYRSAGVADTNLDGEQVIAAVPSARRRSVSTGSWAKGWRSATPTAGSPAAAYLHLSSPEEGGEASVMVLAAGLRRAGGGLPPEVRQAVIRWER